jgi:geranylgeranyl pyrophosphate synthase
VSDGVACAGRVQAWQTRLEQALAQRLPDSDAEPTRLHAAMRYCVLNAGERVHPLLLFGTARALGLAEAQVEAAACALELIHAYSRVHDDLPALADDAGADGRPACHAAYDEGTAVLVGDALQSLAFQLLAGDAALPASADIRLRLIALLAEAIGAGGLTGGQSLDVEAHGRQLSVAELEALYSRRTGALLRASVLMAAECAPPAAAHLRESLGEFATALALALQIRRQLRGARAADGRPSYPRVIGPEAMRQRLDRLHARTLEALQPLGAAAEPLRELASWLLAEAPAARAS